MSSRYPQTEWQSNAKRVILRLQQLGMDWPNAPELQGIGERTLEELIDIVHSERERHWHNSLGLMITNALICLAIIMGQMTGALICLLYNCLLRISIGVGTQRQQRYATYALTQTNDLRVLPLLIQATAHEWGRHPAIIAAITRLLSQITEAHSDWLTDSVQEQLWQAAIPGTYASRHYNEDFALTTLRTLTRAGNQNTYNRMQKLADGIMKYDRHWSMIMTVRYLLPKMEARLKRQQTPATLLRASAAPAAPSDTLLRPTLAATSEPNSQLLRAHSSEPAEE